MSSYHFRLVYGFSQTKTKWLEAWNLGLSKVSIWVPVCIPACSLFALLPLKWAQRDEVATQVGGKKEHIWNGGPKFLNQEAVGYLSRVFGKCQRLLWLFKLRCGNLYSGSCEPPPLSGYSLGRGSVKIRHKYRIISITKTLYCTLQRASFTSQTSK